MTLKALSNILHNDTEYVTGNIFEVDNEKQAQALIDAKAAEKEETKEPEKKSLDKMNKTELMAEAKEKGIVVSEDMKNADIIAKIKGE